ncbi:MAG: hypothetical protein KGL39_04140 [Patescibacteria group bacterium]|nr:hypothetical protein [Patescibacteria group bacterium]
MTEPELPPNPVTPLTQMAATTRELFESLVAAGYTEAQGLRLIGIMMAELARTAQQ